MNREKEPNQDELEEGVEMPDENENDDDNLEFETWDNNDVKDDDLELITDRIVKDNSEEDLM